MKRLVIKGGRVVDPSASIDGTYNIYVMGGRIASVKAVDSDDTELAAGAPDLDIIDASGLLVVPGLVDIHTHLREPGHEYKETILSGAEAAAAGGFTTILCMANTVPVNDNQSVTRYILKKAEDAVVNVRPVGALSAGLRGERITEMADLSGAGCAAVSDDGMPVVNAGLMRRALEYSKVFALPVITHAEDPALACGGVMNEGEVSTRLGLGGVPNVAEDAMVARDIMLAELTGGRLHIAHVSTRGAVELVRAAKARGVNVTAEATPHHLVLTEARVAGYDTDARMNPPLRTSEDVRALVEGVNDGTIDAIATDHAPQSVIEKDVEFNAAANGVIGLETAFSIVYSLVLDGTLDLKRALEAMTTGPARAMNLDRGTLKVGAPADITLIDLDRQWTVDPAKFKSKSRNTPFAGMKLKGRAVLTIVDGRTVYENRDD
jgi:dihydroorotase